MTDPILAHGRRVAPRHADGAVKLNDRIALAITRSIGTMWSAYLFMVLALLSLPAILVQGGFVQDNVFPHWLVSVGLIALVAWIAQTFFQLVLLPVILVGQNLGARAGDARAAATASHVDAILAGQEKLQRKLDKVSDDVILLKIATAPKPKAAPRARTVKTPPAP